VFRVARHQQQPLKILDATKTAHRTAEIISHRSRTYIKWYKSAAIDCYQNKTCNTLIVTAQRWHSCLILGYTKMLIHSICPRKCTIIVGLYKTTAVSNILQPRHASLPVKRRMFQKRFGIDRCIRSSCHVEADVYRRQNSGGKWT